MAAPGFSAKPAVDFWDMTNRQDWDLCVNAYKGVISRAWQAGPRGWNPYDALAGGLKLLETPGLFSDSGDAVIRGGTAVAMPDQPTTS